MTLDEMAIAHGTDKSSLTHDYCNRYEHFFRPMRDKVGKMMEIGIAGGNSLRLWQEYFPFSQIFGVDHTEAYCTAFRSVSHDRGMLTKILNRDASEPQFWEDVSKLWCQEGRLFSIVLDDASHNPWATYVAFKHGWKILEPGGLWCIEDIHAGFDPAYRRDNSPNGLPALWTAHDWLCDIARERLHENGANQCGNPTVADIESIHLSKSLAIIKKR